MKKKKIIVIGGSSGIGKAVAEMAAEWDNQVILTSRSLERAESTARAIGSSVIGRALDVSDEAQVQALFKQTTAIDHIYIAAGSTQLGPLTEGNLDENMKAFNTRLMGGLYVVKAAINKMNSGGSFVFTGGVSTDRPIAGAWVSGLGTASAEQLARVLVLEFPTFRFNAVSPGYTDTPMWDGIMGAHKTELLADIAAKIPVKKIATAAEVASAVLFLMSNASINGETIHVDGGSRLI